MRPVTSFEPRRRNDAKRLRLICRTVRLSDRRIISNLAEGGGGGSGGGFSCTGPSAEGNWGGLGYGNRRRRFLAGLPKLLQTRDVFLISWEQWASLQYVFCFMRAVSERAVRYVFHESREWASSMFFISWEQWASEQYVLYFMRAGSERAVRYVFHESRERASSTFCFTLRRERSERFVFSFLRSCERASGFFFVPTELWASERYVLYYIRAESGASRRSKLASLDFCHFEFWFSIIWSYLIWSGSGLICIDEWIEFWFWRFNHLWKYLK